MPEFVHWLLANPVRWVIPAVLLLSLSGVPFALWWEKHRPTVPDHVAEMRAWRSLSGCEQGGQDNAVLDASEMAETGTVRSPRNRLRQCPDVLDDGFDAAARARAEKSLRLALKRGAEVNALFRP